MILYTSLSPSPKAVEVQRSCLQSWIDHGHTVICVQCWGEDVSESIPREHTEAAEVIFVKPTMSGHKPRPYVGLDSIIDNFLNSGHDRCGIINGDIEIYDEAHILSRDYDDLVCLQRHDHDGDRARAKIFPSGFDMFILTREHAMSVPRSMFVIGQTFWDYWLPWSAAQAGHRLRTIDTPLIFHKRHPLNYAHHDWLRTVHHFCWLTGRSTMVVPTRVSGEIHSAINKAIKKP